MPAKASGVGYVLIIYIATCRSKVASLFNDTHWIHSRYGVTEARLHVSGVLLGWVCIDVLVRLTLLLQQPYLE